MIAAADTDGSGPTLTGPTASALGHPRRRLVLAELLDAGEPRSVEQLAREIRARRRNDPDGPPTRNEVETSLHHRHVPALAAAGLVECRDDVRLSPHPILSCDAVCPAALRDDGRPWEALKVLVTEPRRIRIVGYLADRLSVELDDLVAALRSHLSEPELRSVPGRDLRGLLHHVDLPRLADVGVLSYDDDTHRVELEQLPDPALLPDRFWPDSFQRDLESAR